MRNEKIKVLFVDDDTMLGNIVVIALEEDGYEVHFQSSLAGIEHVIAEIKPDILVLDVEVGKNNSIDAVPGIKLVAPDMPLLFISSHLDPKTIFRTLNIGGIAYIKKPFEIGELIAHIRHYSAKKEYNTISLGIFSIQLEERTLLENSIPKTQLSNKEFRLLRLLISSTNKTINRQTLLNQIWGNNSSDEHNLNNCIAKLRQYLSSDPNITIETIRGAGYKLTISNNKTIIDV